MGINWGCHLKRIAHCVPLVNLTKKLAKFRVKIALLAKPITSLDCPIVISTMRLSNLVVHTARLFFGLNTLLMMTVDEKVYVMMWKVGIQLILRGNVLIFWNTDPCATWGARAM
jgi:hypothetical protein